MNAHRLLFAFVVGCCFLRSGSLPAQTAPPPFTMDKQFSADFTMTMKDGTTLQGRTFMDGDKSRSEMTNGGADTVTIIRKDQQKIYQLMVPEKMMMELPLDTDKSPGNAAAAFGPDGRFELVGPDTIDGIACTKYKVTSKDNQVVFFWVDTVNKVPLRMAAPDDSFVLKWKNYKAGPQPASLFEVPDDYQAVGMPSMPVPIKTH